MNPSEFTGTLYNWFGTKGPADNRHPSAHWLVGRDGTKARVVPDDRLAWHAASDNPLAWGIELEQGVEADGFTLKQMESFTEICRGYVKDWGVQPRHVSGTHLSGFVGHQETIQGQSVGKSDPGSEFVWNAFIASLEDEMDQAEFNEMFKKAVDEVVVARQKDDGIKVNWSTLDRILNDVWKHTKEQDHSASGPQQVTFPGATVSIPSVTVPVEDA
jgi:N-acetyl-anhydromuramyl-L-alanine amidase AmpD